MAWFIQKLNGRYAAVFVSGVPGMEVEEATRAEDEISTLRAQLATKDERLQMAITLLGYCKPHVEAMVGIASSARGVPEMIDMFLDGTLEFEKPLAQKGTTK